MSTRDGQRRQSDTAADVLYLVDQLEELVTEAKRVPLSNRVMVEEDDFRAIVDQLRESLPQEIRQAQRVIKERERIIGQAQDEADQIVSSARMKAEALVAQHQITNDARQLGESILRRAEEEQQRLRGEMDVFVLQQIEVVQNAARRSMAVMEGAVEEALDLLDGARDAVGK